MCGITGILSPDTSAINTPLLEKMAAALAHRGPDGQGTWMNPSGTVGFGHRRLSIIDLSVNAAQPMHYAGRYSIVYNGEIYNYLDIKATLAARGYLFTTASDTEVILAAYACWNTSCLQYFTGMFAFAIWDEQESVLFAARDRFGEKPFFYHDNGQAFFFGSEVKSFRPAGILPAVNETLLYNFLTIGYTGNPRDTGETSFREIRKLPAGCYFTITPDQRTVVPVRYWTITGEAVPSLPAEERVGTFYELLGNAVQERLRSDVSLGTSLSGGIDSSSIAALIRKGAPGLCTFSAVFPGFKKDESSRIGEMTNLYDLTSFRITPNATGLLSDLDKIAWHQESYMTSASVYAQYKVFELACQQGIKVLLDGQGADELLAGYGKYYPWFWQELYLRNKSLLQPEVNAAADLGISLHFGWQQKMAARWPEMAVRVKENLQKRRQSQYKILDKDFVNAYGESYYRFPLPGQLNHILYYNSFGNGLEELLHYADRNSMAHGREVRLPFLDHRLAAYIYALPATVKIKAGYTKWILRSAMSDQLPASICWNRVKTGFEPPQGDWLNTPAAREAIRAARQLLVEKRILDKKILDKKIQPQEAYAAENMDWRCLSAAALFRSL